MSASPDIEVFYDGGCPICRWEIELYDRFDKAKRIRWTDIESLNAADLPASKTKEELLGKFHVQDLANNETPQERGQWFIGVDAFARIWKVLPGFRHFAFLFRLPIIRQLTMLAYLGFLKWQRRHRAKRRDAGEQLKTRLK